MFQNCVPRALFSVRLDNDKTSSAPIEQSMIARAKLGERDAFEAIFIRYRRQVLRTASGILGNAEDAADAAQDVFLRLHKYLHRFNEDRQFSPWLYQVTVNVCREMLNRRRPTVSLERETEFGTFDRTASASDVEREFAAEQERRIIADALATLSEKERSAIVLRDVEGLDTKEVARILGSSEPTVRSQICMARVKIKKYRDKVLKTRDK